MSKNCPNCGAVYTLEDIKCPYCGSLYFDMTAIDFTNNEPIFIKFKIGCDNDVAYVTQCAIPKLETFETRTETMDVTDHFGNIVKKIAVGRSAFTNVCFDAIPFGKDKKLFEVKYNV